MDWKIFLELLIIKRKLFWTVQKQFKLFGPFYAKPKPSLPSVMAIINFSINCSFDLYSGRSNWLKHVCPVGRASGFPALWIWNFWGPEIPLKTEKPSNGTFEVPVTNCKRLALWVLSISSRISQNHLITWELASNPWYSVFSFKSTTIICIRDFIEEKNYYRYQEDQRSRVRVLYCRR